VLTRDTDRVAPSDETPALRGVMWNGETGGAWAAELGARAFMTTKQVALPNILLGREVFPELLQKDATATRMSDALADVLDRRETLLGACNDVIAALGAKSSASTEVANMLRP